VIGVSLLRRSSSGRPSACYAPREKQSSKRSQGHDLGAGELALYHQSAGQPAAQPDDSFGDETHLRQVDRGRCRGDCIHRGLGGAAKTSATGPAAVDVGRRIDVAHVERGGERNCAR